MSFYNNNKGIIFMIIATFLSALTSFFSKILSTNINPIEIVFFRNLIGLLIMGYLLKNINFKAIKFSKRGVFFLILRGVIGSTALIFFYFNITLLGLAEATTFTKSIPIFLSINAFIFFKERLSLISWICIFVGFYGVFLVMNPNLGLKPSDFFGVINAFLAALSYTIVRELREFFEDKIIVLAFLFFSTFLPLVYILILKNLNFSYPLLSENFRMPFASEWIFIVLMGISGILFQITITKAFTSRQKVGVVSAMNYVEILFSIMFGMILGEAIPNLKMFLGIILIVLSGIIIAYKK